MRRWLITLVLAAGLAAIAYALLGGGEPRRPRPLPEQEEAPEVATTGHDAPIPPPATTGTLVIRLRLPEGKEMPANAQAGYRRFGRNRLRPPGADGAFRFSDVPIGLVEAIADVEGFEADPVSVMLVSGTPADALILLKAVPTPPK